MVEGAAAMKIFLEGVELMSNPLRYPAALWVSLSELSYYCDN